MTEKRAGLSGARLQIERSHINAKHINTTCSEEFALPRPKTEARVLYVAKIIAGQYTIFLVFIHEAQTRPT